MKWTMIGSLKGREILVCKIRNEIEISNVNWTIMILITILVITTSILEIIIHDGYNLISSSFQTYISTYIDNWLDSSKYE